MGSPPRHGGGWSSRRRRPRASQPAVAVGRHRSLGCSERAAPHTYEEAPHRGCGWLIALRWGAGAHPLRRAPHAPLYTPPSASRSPRLHLSSQLQVSRPAGGVAQRQRRTIHSRSNVGAAHTPTPTPSPCSRRADVCPPFPPVSRVPPSIRSGGSVAAPRPHKLSCSAAGRAVARGCVGDIRTGGCQQRVLLKLPLSPPIVSLSPVPLHPVCLPRLLNQSRSFDEVDQIGGHRAQPPLPPSSLPLSGHGRQIDTHTPIAESSH